MIQTTEDGCSVHPADIECNFTAPDVGFTCTQSFTAIGTGEDGFELKIKSEGHGYSLESKEAACAIALAEAQERAELLLSYRTAS